MKDVEVHLKTHPEDAAVVAAHLEALTDDVMNLDPIPLPADAEDKLLTRIRAETSNTSDLPESKTKIDKEVPANVIKLPGRPANRLWLRLAAAAAILAGAWFGLRAPIQNYQVEQQFKQYSGQQGAITETLTNEQNTQIGRLVRLANNSVVIAMDSRSPENSTYQAWEIKDGTPISLGTWDAKLFSTAQLSEGSVFGVTVEPPGGSSQPTTTPIVIYQL